MTLTRAAAGSGADDGTAAGRVVTPAEPPSGRPAGALAWSVANTAAAKLGTLAISVVIARELGPAEFGTYAVAWVALVAVLSFNELGVSLAVVRWPDDPRTIAATVTTVSVISSGVLTLLLVLGAPAFAGAMGDASATPLVQLLALCVLLNGCVAVPAALLQRYFRQGRRAVADQLNVWVGAGVSLALVLTGAGALGLVLGRLAGTVVSAVVLVRASPLPWRLGLDRSLVRPLLSFGLPLAGASILVFAAGFVDQLVVGAFLGPVLLGSYVLAANLASWPVHLMSQPLRSVAPALFSRLQHDGPAQVRALGQVARPLTAVALPVCVTMAATAPELVRLVYGAAWAPAGTVLRWLAVAAALRIACELCYDYLVVRGRSAYLMTAQVAWVACLLPAVAVGASLDGLRGAALAQAAVGLLVGLPVHAWGLRRDGVPVAPLLRPLATAVVLAAAVAAVVAVLRVSGGVTDLILVLLGSGLGGLVGAGLLWRHRGDLRVWRDRQGGAP